MPRGVYDRKKKADEVAAAEADGFHQADADGPSLPDGVLDGAATHWVYSSPFRPLDLAWLPSDVRAAYDPERSSTGQWSPGNQSSFAYAFTAPVPPRFVDQWDLVTLEVGPSVSYPAVQDEADTAENIDDALGESTWVADVEPDDDDGPQPGPDRGPLAAGSDAAMSELEARGRAGIRVTDYGPGGEARDYDVERPEPPPAPQPPTTAVMTATSSDAPLMRQLMLDGFPEQQVAHEAAINIAGRIVLNLNSSTDQARWRALPLGQRVIVSVAAIVVARIGRLSLDADLQDKKRLASASLKVVGMHGDAVEAEPDEDDDSDSGTALADLAAAAHQLLARPHLTTDAATEFIERVAAHGRAVALRCEECGERGATFRARYDGDLCDSCFAKRQDLDDLDADDLDPVDGDDESELTKALAEAATDVDEDEDGDA